MKFKTGFVLGAAAGAWAASKAAGLQRSRSTTAPRPTGLGDEAAEKLRALTGLARERLADIMDGPVAKVAGERAANLARDRIVDLIGAGAAASMRPGSRSGASRSHLNGAIDANGRWPR
ncbi:MAG TPA: hypothetical protein VKU92_11180 [Acidimicrobiales bacterium]|nr:hypothetical protein [Acidimicrobiales bacterium]